MTYKIETLTNGLRIITHPMKERDSIAFGIWVNAGGRHESDEIKGAAHFVEHMLFKGSKSYSCAAIKELIEGVGGALNAFTSEEQTCYYAKIPSKHLDKTFDILTDMVFFPTIAAADLKKEKTVIMEEIKMYHDLPQYFVLELMDKLVWPNHPLGKSLAGTSETVRLMTPKKLKDFCRTYYQPNNIVISACGHISHQKIVSLVQSKLGKIKGIGDTSFMPVSEREHKPQAIFHHKETEQMHVALGFRGINENDDNKYIASLLSVILGGNMSSRLFVEVREKRGLAYSISSAHKSLHDTGMFLIRAGVDNLKIVDAVTVIVRELEKIKRQDVSRGEFKRAKDYILGQLLLGLEDTLDHMLWIGEELVAKNRVKDLKRVIRMFESITPKDVQAVSRQIFEPEAFNLTVVGQLKDNQKAQLNKLLGVC